VSKEDFCVIPLYVLRSTASTVFPFSGPPDAASLPVRRSFLEPKRQGEVWRLVSVHVLTRLNGSLLLLLLLLRRLLRSRLLLLSANRCLSVIPAPRAHRTGNRRCSR